jgi:hypothetical protein
MYETHIVIQDSRRERSQRVYSPPSWKTMDDAAMELSSMKKRELVRLFLHCDPPSNLLNLAFCNSGIKESEGKVNDDWAGYDGYLLDNGPILTHVTNFITHQLFGRGKRWLGKVYFMQQPITTFSLDNNDSVDSCGTGRNRFLNKQNEAVDRTFDYYIGKSILPSASSSSSSASSKSLFHSYAPHCPRTWSPMSLFWRGMVDELRVVPLKQATGDNENEEKALLLLGMGYFTWSGGVMNMAPFCLVARRREKSVR